MTGIAPEEPEPPRLVQFIEIVAEPVSTTTPQVCSCIYGARKLGADIPFGTNAEDLKANSRIFVGALALFSYEKLDHVGVVIKIAHDGWWQEEENFEKTDDCAITTRFVSYVDPFFRGFHDTSR